MDIILIGGLWLDGSTIWRTVVDSLHSYGHRGIPVGLPAAPGTTLDEQVAAVLAAVDAARSPLVVGHSAACGLAWLAADARPAAIARVVLIGGFPSADGSSYADFFPLVDGLMPFPGWAPFEGPDAADLSPADRARIADAAVPVPGSVAQGIVRLRDERRFTVPVTVVCPEFSPAQAREWVDGGEVPELARAHDVSYVDIDSGHWPMVSCPDRLAALLAGLA